MESLKSDLKTTHTQCSDCPGIRSHSLSPLSCLGGGCVGGVKCVEDLILTHFLQSCRCSAANRSN